jgi:hypothetical protein
MQGEPRIVKPYRSPSAGCPRRSTTRVTATVLAGLLVSLAAGCGAKDGLVPVAGIVELDGAPLERSAVTFRPLDGTAGPGGMAITDAAGRFVIYSPQGKKGMTPGSYKVTVSRRESKTPVVEGSAVIDSDLVEKVPGAYSDPEKTELTATIGAKGDGELRFQLTGGAAAGKK